MPVQLRPINRGDLGGVAEFMHRQMDSSVPTAEWERLMKTPWGEEGPNSGFMLVEGDAVVGAYLAFYCERPWAAPLRICNLGTWCVAPRHRLHSLRLLRALLDQEGYLFTDLTPDETVIAVNRRLGFSWLPGPAALVPPLPWPAGRAGGSAISFDPEAVEAALSGPDLAAYRDHAGCEAVVQAALTEGDERCHIVLRLERRLGMPVAILLHVSNPRLYLRLAGAFGRRLLRRHAAVAQLAERAILPQPPRPAKRVRAPRRMLLAPNGIPERMDYLYSELARLRW
ncbi:MAG: hypothetical protein FJW90_02470 [Actinobacteria bacterium]|nr:hypothetical protein [Actinomycetota bacterium]